MTDPRLMSSIIRQEIAKDIWRTSQTLAGKVLVTFDTHAIQVILFPKDENFIVPGGPRTVVVKNGQLEEY